MGRINEMARDYGEGRGAVKRLVWLSLGGGEEGWRASLLKTSAARGVKTECASCMRLLRLIRRVVVGNGKGSEKGRKK